MWIFIQLLHEILGYETIQVLYYLVTYIMPIGVQYSIVLHLRPIIFTDSHPHNKPTNNHTPNIVYSIFKWNVQCQTLEKLLSSNTQIHQICLLIKSTTNQILLSHTWLDQISHWVIILTTYNLFKTWCFCHSCVRKSLVSIHIHTCINTLII